MADLADGTAEPVDPQPVDPRPVDPQPVETRSVDPEPVETVPADPETADQELTGRASTKHGAGRVLVVVYAVLAVASVSRAAYELLTKFSQAPVPYALSAFAAVVYCVITWALIASTPTSRRIATVGMVVELVGVLVVGTLSVLDGSVFPKSSVWFWYGRDYLFIPLLLPILGLVFLRRSRAEH